MASGIMTLLDLAIRSGNDQLIGLVDEAARPVPEVSGFVDQAGELRQLPMIGMGRTINGVNYKTRVRTSLPTIGFLDANQGSQATGGVYENRMVETFVLNPWWSAAVAIADRAEDGPAAYLLDEADANMQAAMRLLGRQFYYGVQIDAKGHPGLIDSLQASQTVDAGGTTAGTGSSVWAVRWGQRDVQWVFGEKGQLRLTDIEIRDKYDASGNRLSQYVQELFAYPGLQCMNTTAVGRIKNITADAGKTLTATLLRSLVLTFPAAMRPNALFCTRRSLGQYAASLTATTQLARGGYVATPLDFEGIPLIPTDSLTDTEVLG
jgi:hypothetical protein